MKVGEYARTKNCNMPSLIGKIIKEEYMIPCNAEHKYIYLIDTKNNNVWFEEDNILKSSTNIMDLIEVGDFITYKKGNMYIDIPYRVYGTYNEILEETELRIDDEYLKDIEILSIVTHEQFERMQYNLESEVN